MTFCSFSRADYENGYSRNLLWRLWHLAHTLATQHLFQMCTEVKIKANLNYQMCLRRSTGQCARKVFSGTLTIPYNTGGHLVSGFACRCLCVMDVGDILLREIGTEEIRVKVNQVRIISWKMLVWRKKTNANRKY